MAITPTGAPPWTRQTSHTDYGGNTAKRNFMGQGVVNALTDVGAEDFCRACSDLAAIARTAPMWVITFLCNDSVIGNPTIEVAYGMTGVRLLSYSGGSPPTGFPSAVRNGVADVTFTFDANYTDDYGVSGAWLPLTADGCVHGATGAAAITVISGSTVRVRAVSHAGAGISDVRVTLEVG